MNPRRIFTTQSALNSPRRFTSWGYVLLLSAALAAALTGCSKRQSDGYYDDGIKALNAGQYKEAIDFFT
ncbi:MAG: hypothetical protein IJG02_00825, partial [Thermoguttaceae bacterium]|nr:hypothetical protein [Thermoguttaceae bacterium]